MDDPLVKELLASGASWSEMWLKFSQKNYPYDEHFRAVSDYAMSNKIGAFASGLPAELKII